MRDEWTEALSAWLDGELAQADAAELERRLTVDPELAALRDDLQRLRADAAALPDRRPRSDLWPGIEARIRTGGTARQGPDVVRRSKGRTLRFTVPQLAAAAILLLATGGGAVWLAARAGTDARTSGSETALVARGSGPGEAGDLRFASADGTSRTVKASDEAIRQLEQRLADGRGRLDSSTVRVIEESLATIDRAIRRAEAAVEKDPGNAWLNRHLADTKARKVRLLEKANVLATPAT
ncbi:MAG: hypothetical protein RRA92_07500 [Gemmatimonadota bacterium]|nr:hypothetical protein [Gemmatimonadota bacterium]